jgi:hypothetical protein
MFSVIEGPCTLTDGGRCVGRLDGWYDNYEYCTITVSGAGTIGTCPVFDTESCCDSLTIDGYSHSGSDCPQYTTVNEYSEIYWSTDSSVTATGFEICLGEEGSSVAQARFSVSSGPCELEDGGRCVGRPNGYSDYEGR